jgi:hypothetical protein
MWLFKNTAKLVVLLAWWAILIPTMAYAMAVLFHTVNHWLGLPVPVIVFQR